LAGVFREKRCGLKDGGVAVHRGGEEPCIWKGTQVVFMLEENREGRDPSTLAKTVG